MEIYSNGRHNETLHAKHEQRGQTENDAGIHEQHERRGKNLNDETHDAHNDGKHETRRDG